MNLGRRSLLTASGLSALSGLTTGLLAGCGSRSQPATRSSKRGPRRIRYGNEHGSQFAELRMPKAEPSATVVLLHGGYWLPGYGAELMHPLAERFTTLGFATWNVDYRRTREGGGFPATLLDVATAIEHLDGPGVPAGLSENVVLLGHSAGGQLAVWAASRTAQTPGGAPQSALRGAISLSGVLNLTLAADRRGSSGPVRAFMGGSPAQVPERYVLADPTRLVPAGCPVWAVQAADDDVVPAEQSTSYVARAKAAGAGVAAAAQVVVPGDHFSVIDPDSSSFRTIRSLVDRAIS